MVFIELKPHRNIFLKKSLIQMIQSMISAVHESEINNYSLKEKGFIHQKKLDPFSKILENEKS